jgi:hypothetical protein
MTRTSPSLSLRNTAMPESSVSLATLVLLERIAGAIREELGEAIDAYPGCRSPEGADPINRTFRAVVRRLVEQDDHHESVLDRAVSKVLRLLVERRLSPEDWTEDDVKTLIEEEPGSPDDWLTFLILSSRPQIERLLDPDDA